MAGPANCVDNITTLRITEHTFEWNAPLYLIFIDFQITSDTITHNSIWKGLTDEAFLQN